MPYDSPMKKKGSSCMQMKDHKGKPSGLMMEGSVAHQESAEQEVVNLETKNPVDDKASAMEMSPLNDNHNIDPKTGKRVVQPFVDPGPDPSPGFTDESRPYDLTSEGGTAGQYDEEAPSKRFFGAQKQAQNALNIAREQLGGTDVINQRVQGHGSSTLSGPAGAQVITGYSVGEQGQETVGGRGKVRFNKDAVQTRLDELDKLAITDPVKARTLIRKNISGSALGDFRNKFMRDVNPLNE